MGSPQRSRWCSAGLASKPCARYTAGRDLTGKGNAMTAEFDAAIFKRRRDQLIKNMQDGVAIFPSAPTFLRNGDVHHGYRQHSDFFYLTGFEEPGSLALIIKGHGDHSFVLFVPKRDKVMEIWNGR